MKKAISLNTAAISTLIDDLKSEFVNGTWIPSDTAVTKYSAAFFKVSRVVSFNINCVINNSVAGTGYQLIKLTKNSYVPRTVMPQYVVYYGKYSINSTAAFADTMCFLSIRNIDDIVYISSGTGSGFIKGGILTSGVYCVI